MKVLQVGNIDTIGARFNGADLSRQLREAGVESENCVWEKNSSNDRTCRLSSFPGHNKIRGLIRKLENILSVQSVFYPFSFFLSMKRCFRESDVIHYHLIHTGFFSLLSLPLLTKLRPSVWTLHDPWAMTGHCVYPLECKKWLTGCGVCPNLGINIPMKKDKTKFMWSLKNRLYKKSLIHIVVASKWMYEMAKRSPLLSNFKVHLIPFGLNLNQYKPSDQGQARSALGISQNNFVIFFRATNSVFKGQQFVKECLNKIKTERNITIITVDQKNQMREFENKFQIIDLGWTDDAIELINAYNACDIFLMPSSAEAFGLMAIEAMACAKPVVTFKGTALEEVIFAPSGGVSVPMGDSDALAAELQKFIDDPLLSKRTGEQALEIVRQNYDEKVYISKLVNLYREIC